MRERWCPPRQQHSLWVLPISTDKEVYLWSTPEQEILLSAVMQAWYRAETKKICSVVFFRCEQEVPDFAMPPCILSLDHRLGTYVRQLLNPLTYNLQPTVTGGDLGPFDMRDCPCLGENVRILYRRYGGCSTTTVPPLLPQSRCSLLQSTCSLWMDS